MSAEVTDPNNLPPGACASRDPHRDRNKRAGEFLRYRTIPSRAGSAVAAHGFGLLDRALGRLECKAARNEVVAGITICDVN